LHRKANQLASLSSSAHASAAALRLQRKPGLCAAFPLEGRGGRGVHRGVLGRRAESRSSGFKPDRTRHAKATPFKRNDQLLQTMPIGVAIFPGSGITDSFADKEKVLEIQAPWLACGRWLALRCIAGCAELRGSHFLVEVLRHIASGTVCRMEGEGTRVDERVGICQPKVNTSLTLYLLRESNLLSSCNGKRPRQGPVP
jgi:hypothetical protein